MREYTKLRFNYLNESGRFRRDMPRAFPPYSPSGFPLSFYKQII